MPDEVNLPIIQESILPSIKSITDSLHVPRTVLAEESNILYAWRDLPRELNKIPIELRDELLARMCVAIATGLFDGAINYIWNAAIKNLRKKIIDFGLTVVSKILSSNFDLNKLQDLKDADLLNLCLKLNLIDEEGYFFLDQCRDIRNNFSAAHPSNSLIDDRELICFINRCGKYALSSVTNPRGITVNDLLNAVKGNSFTQPQLDTWVNRIKQTHDAQRELLFEMLHGIYCDPSSKEEYRNNSLLICQSFSMVMTPKTKSILLDSHYEYQAKGDSSRYSASQLFFDKLGFLSLLNTMEKHAIISIACKRMISVHCSFDNFYNEPPFAERLHELSEQGQIPDTAKEEFVICVLTCFVGNIYGYSRGAVGYYEKMIKNFSPKEIHIMLNIKNTFSILSNRLKSSTNCQNRYFESVKIINNESVGAIDKNNYNDLLNRKF